MRGLIRARLHIGALCALAASLPLLVACSDSSLGAKPSPETIETAESVSRPVRILAPASTTPESEDDGNLSVPLNGHVFGHGQTGVILAHMRPADQTAWFPFATKLAATGAFTAMTFDFRGFGESPGDKEFDRVDTDLDAAYRYMRDTLGIEKIFLVGASMGGTASLAVGAREPVAGVVSISSPAQFEVLDATQDVADIDAPKLFVASQDDVPAANSLRDLADAASAPKDEHVYDGDAHGTALFDGPDADDLTQRLMRFLSSN